VVVAAVVLIGAAIAAGMSLGQVLLLTLVAVTGATVVNLAGVALSGALGERSLAVQVAVVPVTAVAATAAGTVLTMVLAAASDGHMRTLVVALAASAAAALVESLLLSVRVASRAEVGAEKDLRDRRANGRDRSWEATTSCSDGAVDSSHHELMAWVAEDLRVPLRAISGVVDALVADRTAPDLTAAARHHAAIHHESERLVRLVDDLYELGRGQGGELGAEAGYIGLSELVRDTIDAMGPAAAARGVRLEAVLESVSSEVAAPAPVLARVVRALLDDAVGHAARGTLVQVETSSDGHAAVLSVRDNCGGFASDERDRVFDVAFAEDDCDLAPAADEGHDLGSARRLVQAQRGQLVVERLADGCRATVRLPLAA